MKIKISFFQLLFEFFFFPSSLKKFEVKIMEIPQVKFFKKSISWKEVQTFNLRWGLKSIAKISLLF